MLAGESDVKLQVEHEQDLKNINYMKQVSGGEMDPEAATMLSCRVPDVPPRSQLMILVIGMQGDAAFYSDAALKERHDLRHDPSVVAAVKDWWT